MESNYITKAEEYYKLVGQKDAEGIKKYLQEDVEFRGPLATLKGKQAVVGATSNFMKAFASLKIRAKFGAGNQAAIVYDVDIPGVSTHFPSVSLLTFQNGLIVRIELFYDGTPFAEKKKEIFS